MIEKTEALREASAASVAQVESLMSDTVGSLKAMNDRLIELHELIRSAQPKSSGTVALDLINCGKACTGCPHGRWVKYKFKPRSATLDNDKLYSLVSINLTAQHKDPILALPRGKDYSAQVAEYIREAKSILNIRSQYLAKIRALRPFA